MQIRDVRITPIAFPDPPLLNSSGVHQPFALRTIIEVETDEGLVGLGETYGGSGLLTDLQAAAQALPGLDPFDVNGLARRLAEIKPAASAEGLALAPGTHRDKAAARLFSALEVPCVDLQAQALGRPVCDLLGGAVRDKVSYSAYLFYKYAEHRDDPGYPADEWGEALDPDGLVEQARQMIDRYGFQSIKLKGGVFEPDLEIDTMRRLRQAFPHHPLRIDPNAGWTVETSIRVGKALTGTLEYLEDPTAGLEGMAEVARQVDMPLATNMVVTTFDSLPRSVELGSVGVVLADHHYWGGFRGTLQLASICRTWGLGLSMHSNSHLGISLAVMTHLAASLPELTYACDTHQPWQSDEVIQGGKLTITDGAVTVPDGPGLGVTLDRDALARLHEQYLHCGIRDRDDRTQMRQYDPTWTGTLPRW